jgi:hypothetical protein
MNRLVIIPDETLELTGASLRPRLSGIVRELNADNLLQAMGEHTQRYLAHVSEGYTGEEFLLWARQGNGFAVAWASGSARTDVEGRVRADAEEGMIARIFATGRAESEPASDLQVADWTNLERVRGATIEEMSASPVFVFESCSAVFSRVRYRNMPPSPSAEQTVLPLADNSYLIGRLIEDRLIRAILGLESA